MKKLIEKICKKEFKSEETSPKHGLLVESGKGVCTDARRLLILDTPLEDGWYEGGATKKDCPGRFPDYRRVLPKNAPKLSFSFPAHKLLASVRFSSVMARYHETAMPGMSKNTKDSLVKANNQLFFAVTNDTLVLSSRFFNRAGGKNTVEIGEKIAPVWNEENDGTMNFSLNCNYAMDFLRAAKEEVVTIKCYSPVCPFVFSIPGAEYILMPMTIKEAKNE